VAELVTHPLVYFVDSMLQVDDLDAPRRRVPTTRGALSSTNVFVQIGATRVGGGTGPTRLSPPGLPGVTAPPVGDRARYSGRGQPYGAR
jgi:hypothetical protein